MRCEEIEVCVYAVYLYVIILIFSGMLNLLFLMLRDQSEIS